MHFRDRGNFVQVIRTNLDPTTKKGKNELVGRLVKGEPKVPEELTATLSAEERKEVATWIAGSARIAKLKSELAARTIHEQLALAQQWFSDQKSDDARLLADGVVQAWVRLRMTLKKSNLIE